MFEFNSKGGFSFVTSSITLLEVLVKPIREGKSSIADRYKEVLTTATGIEILDVTAVIADSAAQLRAKYNLKTPDAIQIATSIDVGANYFLTNDNRLRVVREIELLAVSDLQ